MHTTTSETLPTGSERHAVHVDGGSEHAPCAFRRVRNPEQELLAAVVEQGAELVCLTTWDGRVLYLNEAGRKMLGIALVSDAHRAHFDDFFPEEDGEQIRSVGIPTALREGHWESDLQLRRFSDHAAVSVWFSLFPLDAHSPGQPAIVAGVARDMSSRRKTEQELQSMVTQLQRSNRELEAFGYVASHDLQEPLRNVRAFGRRLKTTTAGRLDDVSNDCLERIDRSVARMQTLIQDLLRLAQVSHHMQTFAPVDLGEILGEVLADLESRIQETETSVVVGELPVVWADAVQMRELFENLISNAIKFHRPGVPPRIHVASRLLEGSQHAASVEIAGWCEIRVADQGIGFDEKNLDRIFRVFQRLHGRREYEGSGVGLAICRKIVERHGGAITAHARVGEGATFLATLPLAARVAAPPSGTHAACIVSACPLAEMTPSS
jgi:PAS domain S-box-containing protein